MTHTEYLEALDRLELLRQEDPCAEFLALEAEITAYERQHWEAIGWTESETEGLTEVK